jgi:putative GTP pyrophosphokinase
MASRFINAIKSIFNSDEYYGDDAHLQKILTEYKNRKHAYEDFRLAAHKTLDATLREGGYKYQIVSRTKTLERLLEKLLRKKKAGITYLSIHDIEDLVGIRIIFYTEYDKERFLKELRKEIGGFMKIEERDKQNGYKATHIIMAFGPKRLELAEYKDFRGLKSEIQLTSILHHTWAELEHDLIYKDITGLKEKDPKKFELLEREMQEILEKYIKKASSELEEIIRKSTE